MNNLKSIAAWVLAIFVCLVPFVIYGALFRLGSAVMGSLLTFGKATLESPQLLAVALVIGAIFWVQIAFAKAQYTLMRLCSEEVRQMSPAKIWFILIPFIGQVIGVFVVKALSKSALFEFKSRGAAEPPRVASLAGYLFFGSSLLSLVPALKDYGYLLLILYVVSLVIYWRSIGKCRRALSAQTLSLQTA